MSPTRRRLGALLALGLVAAAPVAGAPRLQEDPAALVAALEAPDRAAREEAAQRLERLKSPERRRSAGRLLLEDWAGRPRLDRRRRAALVVALFEPEHLDGVLAALADPAPDVRAALLPLLARPVLGERDLEARLGALERAASGPDPATREAALTALGELDDPLAVERLAGLIERLPPPDRARAAEALPDTARSAGTVARLVAAGFGGPPADRTPDDVLAAVLPAHGRRLAELDGAPSPAAVAPLVLGLRHPSPAVRRAAELAFEALLQRLRALGRSERALDLLAALAARGLDPRVVHYHRARFAFFPAADPAQALASARALRGGGGAAAAGARMAVLTEGAGGLARLWLFRSLYLEGVALLALGQASDADGPLAEAAAVLDAALAGRGDRADEAARWEHVDLLHQRALVEVARVLTQLAAGARPAERAVLERARSAHRLTLQAQVLHARLAGEALGGWDSLLDSDLSPYRLLFTGEAYPGVDMERSLALQEALGRALASVAPREEPGFEPVPDLPEELADPLADPERFELLRAVQEARLEGVSERIDAVSRRVGRRGGTGWEVPEEEMQELESLDLRRRILMDEASRAGSEGWAALYELRVPGSQALWLARDLRNEGRGAESRAVAGRMKADLEAQGLSNWWYYLGVERLVRADMLIGSAYTDDDEPLRAKEALEAAVERLEGLERRLVENGASERDLGGFRALRANALVSLAVNSNVKLGRPEEALEYYEQAYALRQDDFMRVLLACYRARSGRALEARALLREVRPGPQTWYNMACTHALLGDTQQALDYLATELAENHPSEASRQRQRQWAAEDPDLASLREDPRFQELVGR